MKTRTLLSWAVFAVYTANHRASVSVRVTVKAGREIAGREFWVKHDSNVSDRVLRLGYPKPGNVEATAPTNTGAQ